MVQATAHAVAASGGDPLWYLLVAPASVIVAALILWQGYSKERKTQREAERRLHWAMLGYVEGGTTVPGIWNVVVGAPAAGIDGLGKVARDARDTATVIADRQETIEGEVSIIKDMATAAAELSADTKTYSEANATRLRRVEEKVDEAAGLAAEASVKAAEVAAFTSAALDTFNNHISHDLGIHREQHTALVAIAEQVGADVDLPMSALLHQEGQP